MGRRKKTNKEYQEKAYEIEELFDPSYNEDIYAAYDEYAPKKELTIEERVKNKKLFEFIKSGEHQIKDLKVRDDIVLITTNDNVMQGFPMESHNIKDLMDNLSMKKDDYISQMKKYMKKLKKEESTITRAAGREFAYAIAFFVLVLPALTSPLSIVFTALLYGSISLADAMNIVIHNKEYKRYAEKLENYDESELEEQFKEALKQLDLADKGYDYHIRKDFDYGTNTYNLGMEPKAQASETVSDLIAKKNKLIERRGQLEELKDQLTLDNFFEEEEVKKIGK